MAKEKSLISSESNLFIKFPKSVLLPVKNFLTAELLRLKARQRKTEGEDPFNDPSRARDNAAMDTDAAEQFGHVRSQAVKKYLEKRIIQIRKALTRVKIGRYGICERCGKFIDTDRLMAYPETTLCLQCQKEKEK